MADQHLYLQHRALIEETIGRLHCRQRLSYADCEDFAGAFRLHLIEHDCAVLRRFEGRSSLRTFLAAVVAHFYQDWRNARWGKWRPSAHARRHGPIGILLERLTVRDGLTFDEAYETLRTNSHVTEPRAALEAIAAGFPARSGRHFVAEDVLTQFRTADPPTDAPIRQAELAETAMEARNLLARAFHALPPEDRIVLRMKFLDSFTVADIARALTLESKPLYRRIERMLEHLRGTLERSGITAERAEELITEGGFGDISVGGILAAESKSDQVEESGQSSGAARSAP